MTGRHNIVVDNTIQTSLVATGNMALRKRFRRVERWRSIRAFLLMSPALGFLLLAFVLPICLFLFYSINNPEVPGTLPRTVQALQAWDGNDIPGEDAFQALAADLGNADTRAVAVLARRLNYNQVGFRTLILQTAQGLARLEETVDYQAALGKINRKWMQPETWTVLKQESGTITPFYLLASLDLKYDHKDGVSAADSGQQLYISIFQRTFWVSTIITLICVLLGFPIAYLIAGLPPRQGNWLLLLVLLPFWTSLLVRTLAWMVLLRKDGLVNQFLMLLGITGDPLQLLHTRFAIYIGMIHILLPFMILPIYSVMRRISPHYMRAAVSLGANPLVAFWTVYVPQVIPGVGAGVLLVSILALGFYITPELLGAPNDQMISYFVAFYTNQSVNWGMAAALGSWLLLFAVALFALLNRFMGINRMRLG